MPDLDVIRSWQGFILSVLMLVGGVALYLLTGDGAAHDAGALLVGAAVGGGIVSAGKGG